MAIVLFGATGYTGDLTARALARRGARPMLAGRSAARLEALAAELGGLETQVADVSDPGSVRALVGRGDVLLSTVGPFARWGEPAVRAAVAAGAHYVDSTGEGPFIRRVFEEFGTGAQAAGCGLLTAMGYDWAPGNLAGALALRDAGPDAARVDVGYFITGRGGLSGGTRASTAGVMVEPSFAWRGGRLVTERGAARRRSFELRGRSLQAVSVGTTEAFTLPRLQPGLREVGVYLGWFGPASPALQGLSAVLAGAAKVPGVRAGLGGLAARLVKGSTGGPDAPARALSGSVVIAEARSPAGDVLARVRLEGGNGYDLTAEILAWAAERCAAGDLRGTGALGPVDGFGLDVVERSFAELGLVRAD